MGLAELRTTLGVTQGDLARQLGTSQAAVLKTERSSDPRLSSIWRYVVALGAQLGGPSRLEVVAVVDGEEYPLSVPKENDMTPIAPRSGPRTAMRTASMSPTQDRESRAWRVRAWDDPFLEQRFLDEHAVAMSNDELDDLTDFPDEGSLRRRLQDAHPNRGPQAIGTFVRYWHNFRIDMTPDDMVVVPLSGRRAAVGEVAGDYEYVGDEPEPRFRHRRSVRWLGVMERDDLDEDLRGVVNAPGTICRFRASNAADRLRHASEGSSSTSPDS